MFSIFYTIYCSIKTLALHKSRGKVATNYRCTGSYSYFAPRRLPKKALYANTVAVPIFELKYFAK